MDILRTPNSRFVRLADYPFEPHYVDVKAADTQLMRMHYVDEGPKDGNTIVLLHGEPTWSYLYRTMIPPLAEAGYRVLAPDLIGFGRSDKPARKQDYTYLRHVEWVTSWLEALDLTDVTLVVQDWGSLIGLRVAAEQDQRFAKLFIANGFLPTGEKSPNAAFRAWRGFAKYTPWFSAGWLVAAGTVQKLSSSIRAGYDAPFPDRHYQAGARAFPQLVPATPNDPAAAANRRAWRALGEWTKPALCVFGDRDPILGHADRPLIRHIPGAAGQPHARIKASHFIQEDAGPELAKRLIDWDKSLATR